MNRYLVTYVPRPLDKHFPFSEHVRGRWVEGSNYDDARKKLKQETGALIYTAPIGLIRSQIDNPENNTHAGKEVAQGR